MRCKRGTRGQGRSERGGTLSLTTTQPSGLFSAASTAPARSRLQTKFAYTHQTTDPYVICDRHVDQPRYDA